MYDCIALEYLRIHIRDIYRYPLYMYKKRGLTDL